MLEPIEIKFIEIQDHRFNATIGDWWKDDKGYHIIITKMSDWRYEVTVLFHELTEIFISRHQGVSSKAADSWDAFFDTEYEEGRQPLHNEPGFDKRCPYYIGHWWGDKIERIILFLLGGDWKKYCKECEELTVILDK